MKRNLGIIAFANSGGLGIQTKRLVDMLSPYRVMVIDSTPFSRNKEQHFEWYENYDHFITYGFPRNHHILRFVKDLTHVFVCENPYNFYLLKVCKEMGIKTFVQSNYEFCENLNNPHLPVPDVFVMPSYWMVDDMKKRYKDVDVVVLPPPIDPDEFRRPREININRSSRKKRFLHIVGTSAAKDRNGTLDVVNCLKYAKRDFELVITSQHPFKDESLFTNDRRISFFIGNKQKNSELYEDFDEVILPRRYGGLSLVANESLMSALPVIMTDISPNTELLPSCWLVKAKKEDVLRARVDIDVYASDLHELAHEIDTISSFSVKNMQETKKFAYNLAKSEFSIDVLRDKYEELFNEY